MPLRQVPDKPGIDRAGCKHSAGGKSARLRHMLHDPLQLGSREIGRKSHTRLLPDLLCFCLMPFADRSRPGTLPNNGVHHRFPGFPVPGDRGLPLIGNSHGSNGFCRNAGFFDHIPAHCQGIATDLLRVMLHIPQIIDDLAMRPVRPGDQFSFRIKDHSLCSLGALIHGQDIFFTHTHCLFLH